MATKNTTTVSDGCLYCGRLLPLTKEHVIPESLGGAKCVRAVCATCNNTVLSQLDKELAERSPLSIVAAFELHKKMPLSWDVDHEDRNLLLEAAADESTQSMTLWPQMVFDDDGVQLRGDAEEISRFGWDDFATVFVKHMLSAFATVKSGAKRPRMIFERVSADVPSVYRYPPRVYCTSRINAFNARMSFQCRYRHAAERRRVMRELDGWNTAKRFRSSAIRLGSSLPAIKSSYELTGMVRSFAKMAVNLLRITCDKTPVNCTSFSDTVRVVMDDTPVRPALLAVNGFVHADDVRSLECPAGAHRFRLLYDSRKRLWRVYFSFFGGRVGACVRIPGPSREEWVTADIMAPLRSAHWTIHKSPMFQPLRVRIEWVDLCKILPSVPLVNGRSNISVVPRANP